MLLQLRGWKPEQVLNFNKKTDKKSNNGKAGHVVNCFHCRHCLNDVVSMVLSSCSMETM
jgi:hypothetical protein